MLSKIFCLRSIGKTYLFGIEIEDVEELKTKPETSGRNLAVAWMRLGTEPRFDRIFEMAFEIMKILTVIGKTWSQN